MQPSEQGPKEASLAGLCRILEPECLKDLATSANTSTGLRH